MMGQHCKAKWELSGYIPLPLTLFGFIRSTGWVQHLGRVGHIEQGTSFDVALAQ